MSTHPTIKITVCGFPAVGATAIARRFEHDEFDPSYNQSIGTCIAVKNVICNDCTYTVQLWDPAGSELYQNPQILKRYYRNSTVVLFCFALNDSQSFENAKTLIQQYEEIPNHDCVMILVGTKSDLVTPATRCVSLANCQMFCLQHGMYYRDISAKKDSDVDTLISFAIDKVSRQCHERKTSL